MKIFGVILTVMVFIFSLSVSTVLAQPCEGNFDCDQDVDGTDAAVFKEDFGRSPFSNPCPNCPPPGVVLKTRQTTSYATGDDGDLQKGVPWPNPRFTDNGDGTITDNLTGLIWLKDANCMATNYPDFDNDGTPGDGRVTWLHALSFIFEINIGIFSNCGDGNTDWRVPNRWELESLLDLQYYSVAIPNTAGTGKWSEGDPFTNVQLYEYWTSTTYAFSTVSAWYVRMTNGWTSTNGKTVPFFVWPVRGGQ